MQLKPGAVSQLIFGRNWWSCKKHGNTFFYNLSYNEHTESLWKGNDQRQLPGVESRGGHAHLLFESGIATPQLEGSTSATAIPQLLKEFCSATAIPQSQFFWSPQLQVRNLRALLLQFLADFWRGVAWNYKLFYRQVFFCYWEDFKGTVAWDFRPLFTWKNFSTQGWNDLWLRVP